MNNSVQAISPLDGRYAASSIPLDKYFSEAALMKYRLRVEISWFIYLINELQLAQDTSLNSTEIEALTSLHINFDNLAALRVKEIEKTTNHDVKAIEYYLKENLPDFPNITDNLELIHFGCTSEDINNLSYSLMLKESIEEQIAPMISGLILKLKELANDWISVPMLSRTHGQSASPTTVGKEFVNVLARIQRQFRQLQSQEFLGKINGAVGNYNAHTVVYPDINWPQAAEKFLAGLGLKCNSYTTQIEPHDFIAEICDNFKRLNTIVLDLNRDLWIYISQDYFKQKLKAGEIGSSTMPHKVNPIDFENSEGNLGLANALFEHFSAKLPLSRLQRDLTDSTVFRNIGSAIAYSFIAYKSTIKGLNKLELNPKKIASDLENNWEVLAEPIQMMMRRYKISNPYEKLKELSRGKKLTPEIIQQFIATLEIPETAKKQLLELTPAKYIGLASELSHEFLNTKD